MAIKDNTEASELNVLLGHLEDKLKEVGIDHAKDHNLTLAGAITLCHALQSELQEIRARLDRLEAKKFPPPMTKEDILNAVLPKPKSHASEEGK